MKEPVRLPTLTGDELVCPCDVDDIRPDCPFHGESSWPSAVDTREMEYAAARTLAALALVLESGINAGLVETPQDALQVVTRMRDTASEKPS